MTISAFQKIIWKYYKKHKRNLSWRKTKDPYKILVSEVMLQQTQAGRVEVKYASFLKRFPTVEHLAKASLGEVLAEWQGLGYNRRAKYLKQCAEEVVKNYNGRFPKDYKKLCALPGIGPATAGDIMAFAWNIPVVVIETNIRSVFIYFFFREKENVHDREIIPLIQKSLDVNNPREWYWALFDYGAYLKQSSNPSKQSAHYKTQSKFSGSTRQKRGHILRILLEKQRTHKEIIELLNEKKEKAKIIEKILLDLTKEGLIEKIPKNKATYRIVV